MGEIARPASPLRAGWLKQPVEAGERAAAEAAAWTAETSMQITRGGHLDFPWVLSNEAVEKPISRKPRGDFLGIQERRGK